VFTLSNEHLYALMRLCKEQKFQTFIFISLLMVVTQVLLLPHLYRASSKEIDDMGLVQLLL
jgi:hypothetical protein